jgi:hypothetical protein
MGRGRRAWLCTFPVAGVIAGVAWRAEIEWHGWYSLQWIRWFHWAIPLGVALFLASVGVTITRTYPAWRMKKRLLLVASLVAFAPGAYWVTSTMLLEIFSRAFWMFGPSLLASRLLVAGVMALSLLGVPLGVFGIASAFGVRVTRMHLVTSLVGYTVAVPITVHLLDRGGFVDAIKAGYPVPLLLMSLGAVFFPARSRMAMPSTTRPAPMSAKNASTVNLPPIL